MLKRILAGIAGGFTFVSAATLTLGVVLVAPLGILVTRALARRRQHDLTRGAAWLGAVIACFAAVAIGVAVMTATLPPGSMATVRAAMDSAQAQQKPAEIPKWLERVNPSARRQAAVNQKLVRSDAFLVFIGIFTTLMACSMLGTIAGSIGWLASMLLVYAFTGRWIRSGDQPPPLPSDPLTADY